MAKEFSYNKTEKLKSKKQLNHVFEHGKSFTVFPIKVFYALKEDQDNIIKTGVGVSSKHFKKSVHRNRIKRQLREAYRIQKQPLHLHLNNTHQQLAVFLLFVDKTLPAFTILKEKMQVCIQRLIKEIHEVDIKNT